MKDPRKLFRRRKAVRRQQERRLFFRESTPLSPEGRSHPPVPASEK